MKACTLTVPAKAVGAGTQTVTGVLDADGQPFVGAAFLINGNSVLNTMSTAYQRSSGFDDAGSFHRGEVTSEKYTFNAKILGGGSSAVYSILDLESFIAGRNWHRQAYISASRSGEFDITYDLNDTTGESYLITVLGGDDLLVSMGDLNPTTLSIGFVAAALMLRRQTLILGTQQASGGTVFGIGWAVEDGTVGTSSSMVIYQGGNGRYQSSTQCFAEVAGSQFTSTSVTNQRTVTAWGPTTITLSGTQDDQTGYAAFGGIVARAGVLTQPLTTGVQEIVTGIENRVVFLSSIGAASTASLLTNRAEWSYGTMTANDQNVMWGGETVVGNGTPLLGAKWLGNGAVVVSGIPNAGSTTFLAQAESAGFDSGNQSFSLDWTTVDSTPREVIWLALGEASTPVTTATHHIRRLRRFTIPDNNNLMTFFHQLQIYLETGIGLTTGQGSDPQIMLRWSDDAGHTWSNEHWVSAGKIGEYNARAIWWQLGASRDRVFEIVVSDPVAWSLVQAYMDVTSGIS